MAGAEGHSTTPPASPGELWWLGRGRKRAAILKFGSTASVVSLCVSSDSFVTEPRASWEGGEGLAGVCPCRGSGADRGSGFFEVTAQTRAQQLFLEELGILDTNNQDLKTS